MANGLINGDFSVWQRGDVFNISTSGNYTYTADRWRFRNTGNAIVTKQTLSLLDYNLNIFHDIPEYYMNINCNGCNNVQFSQPIEYVKSHSNRKVQLSFGIRYNTTSNVNIEYPIISVYTQQTIYDGDGNMIPSKFQYRVKLQPINRYWSRISTVLDIPSVVNVFTITPNDYISIIFNIEFLNSNNTDSIDISNITMGNVLLTGKIPITEIECFRYFRSLKTYDIVESFNNYSSITMLRYIPELTTSDSTLGGSPVHSHSHHHLYQHHYTIPLTPNMRTNPIITQPSGQVWLDAEFYN